MVYKNFRVNLIIRIALFAVTVFLFFYFLDRQAHITPSILLLLSGLQIYSMFRYVDKTNRDLASFLESIRFSEFTRSFQIEGMGSSFDELNNAFNDVISDFQKVRSEKEEHFHYLQSIVQNIDVSILAYQRDGSVEMINKSAKKLFQLGSVKNVSALSVLSKELVSTLLKIKPGENKLVKVQDEDDLLQLAINATEFKIKNKLVILTTIKNIQNVLEEQETEAWQKLIRVLTHEIMNSITPIASLSSTLEGMLNEFNKKKGENAAMDSETVDEIQQALQTINKRSNGLLHFVNTYRNLTRIPKPNFKITPVTELFSSLGRLMDEDFKSSKISFSSSVDPGSLEISMDEQLIEQVLINLLKNSAHALEGRKDAKINLRAFMNKRGRPTIQVSDNGVGILKDVLDKIFIPFFTTKPSGSGIGLSLSRQILKLHGGTITAKSVPEKETTFTLTF
ncbi:MAG: ATP-binding protein [Bacteroidales bacterium]|nr:ATP-binding protein [Bacteroidales bacterium]MCB9000148.1 ATP-binding protein [Bacteroidales bacterium]MCB9013505.1 ATP-binding protein [Bacteroidales bacterium]